MAYSFSDLQKWVLEWEGPTLEFKSSIQKEVGPTISAFANTYGGIIVFGVDSKKKEMKGVTNPDEESRRLRQVLDQCKPNPKPEQEFLRYENRTFIILKIEPIPHSHNPCFYNDFCFVRQGTTNLKLSGEDLIEFLKKRTLLNCEESRSKAHLNDLDLEKVKSFLRKRKINPKNLNEEDYKRILAGLNVANYNGEFFLKNVALFFFAKAPQKFFTNLEVRIVKYAGTEPELGLIRVDKRSYGTIPELINETFNMVLENTGKTFAITGTERKEIPDYPQESLRELITNALGHRDYFTQKEVLIEIFEDRLQITSPGGLLSGQSINNFEKTPQHRNPITYRLLGDLGLGEGLGLGIRLIRQQCREAKLPDPEFYEIGNAFQAIIYNRTSKKKKYLVDFENSRQKQALSYLQKNKSIKTQYYAKVIGISLPTAVKDLNELVKQGKVKKIGKYRGAYYELENPKQL
ncbi:MAG: ATP-binding protein [Candidatus Micrarchaeota archaeon]